MQILGVIPARYASTRLPAKPLIDLKGKTLIERVYKQAQKSLLLTDIIVATDDRRIYETVTNFGGKAIITDEKHPSGTDRVGEVAQNMPAYDVFINIQGDEPLLEPTQIDALAQKFIKEPEVEIVTLVKKIDCFEDIFNESEAKVILDKNGKALYFSRAPIPYSFKVKDQTQWHLSNKYFKHIGLYAFKKETLFKICKLKISSLEELESLEQLRWLENGFNIHTVETNIETIPIDTPDDIHRVLPLIND